MPHGDVLAYGQQHAFVHMQHAAFLDIAVASDADRGVIAAYADVRPDADARFERHIADDIGAVEDERVGVYGRDKIFELVYRHGVFRRSEEHTSGLQSLMRISYAVFCL